MNRTLLVLVLVVSALLIFAWIFLPPLSRYRDLKQEEERLSVELKQIEKKIAKLQEERDLLQDDLVYIEKVIREELGLVKPGEIVYKFFSQKETPPPATVVEQLPNAPAPFATAADAEGTVVLAATAAKAAAA
jgi:cell division protein FtsB